MATLDHFILKVNDLENSIAFYENVMGFERAGEDGPFTVMQVNDALQILLAPWSTDGNEHFAFEVSRTEFDTIFDQVRTQGIAFGPSFHDVGSNAGPGEERGARGNAPTLYFNDPNAHLIEIRTYDD